jgi:DNA-binding beta-propeller fold protein YncE
VPAQGSIPGVHHVVSDGESIWTCERGVHVARIDAASQVVAACAAVARKASHLALGAAAKKLFLADSEANEVICLRAADLGMETRWAAPGGPQLPVAGADGIVCVTGPATGTLTIARPCGRGYSVQTLEVGACPHDPLLSADQRHVYVPCAGAGSVVKVRLADGAVAGRCASGDGPSHLAAHPDGTRIYAANSWDGTLSCMSADGERLAQAASGGWAHAIDIAPDGRWVYVANFLDDTLAVFDAASLERVALLATDAYPHGLDVTPDGRFVVVAGFGSDGVRIFEATAHREIVRVAAGFGASHAAFAGDSAFVACSVADHVAVLDFSRREVTARISIH